MAVMRHFRSVQPARQMILQIRREVRAMTEVPLVCAACGGTCEEGFLRDVMHGGYKPGMWVEGPPEKSFWSGTKVGDRRQYRVQAFRCVKCGKVELFARESGEYPKEA
jgi:hypothetical protein